MCFLNFFLFLRYAIIFHGPTWNNIAYLIDYLTWATGKATYGRIFAAVFLGTPLTKCIHWVCILLQCSLNACFHIRIKHVLCSPVVIAFGIRRLVRAGLPQMKLGTATSFSARILYFCCEPSTNQFTVPLRIFSDCMQLWQNLHR